MIYVLMFITCNFIVRQTDSGLEKCTLCYKGILQFLTYLL